LILLVLVIEKQVVPDMGQKNLNRYLI